MANVKIYINFLKISCIVYDPRLQSELKDAKRLTKLLIRFFFLFERVYRGFFSYSTNTFSDRFGKVRPIKKF